MLEDIIRAQVTAHPSIRPTDLIKLCFQAAFGAEHLLLDRERAQSYFLCEYEATEITNEPLLEEISARYARMNIGAVKRLSIEPDRAFEVFFLTASEKSADGKRFIKSEELSTAFSQTEAYSDLYMELATNADEAAKFVNGIIPAVDKNAVAKPSDK